VKEISYLRDDDEGFLKKRIKPNFKTLGKRLGKNMKAAAQAIGQFSQEDIAAVEKSGSYTLKVGDEQFELTLADFEITTEDIPGWKVASDGSLTVALDLTLSESLEAEGMARELVNRIQNIRKGKDFDVTDRIKVMISEEEAIQKAVAAFGDYIKGEVLADELTVGATNGGEEVELPGDIKATIGVERVA